MVTNYFKIAIILVAGIVLVLTASQEVPKFGQDCNHSGDEAQDYVSCGWNLLCGIGGTCVCPDTYGITTEHFTPSEDGTVCIESSKLAKNDRSCRHTGEATHDFYACPWNLFCGVNNTCICPDNYSQSNQTFILRSDGKGCTQM